jgi:hypothetical protein
VAAKHYHVLTGMCGLYMPNENHVFSTLREAQSFAREEAARARDEGERVRKVPHAEYGYYVIGNDACIEVTDCAEPDCLSALDD